MLFAVLSGFIVAFIAPLIHRITERRACWILMLLPLSLFIYFFKLTLSLTASSESYIRTSQTWVQDIGVTISFYFDGLSGLFAMLISGIGTLIVIYSGGYLDKHPRQGRFFSFLLMFMASMLGLVLADNLITMFIFWELTSVTSFLLIGFNHLKKTSRRSAMQALIVTGMGGLFLLAGIIIISSVSGTLEISELSNTPEVLYENDLFNIIVLLFIIGAFTKSAQFPFHFWLPNAMAAPTPVSAYLHSATMVKAGIYLLLRFNPIFSPSDFWNIILILFGGFTLVLGAILAIKDTDIKQMLAYTTLASLGLLTLLIGIGAEYALIGAILYLLAHSLFKGTLFMVAGNIEHETDTRNLLNLGGLKKAMPVTFIAAILASLSMCGIPPFVGFLAKETIYHSFHHYDIYSIIAISTIVIGNGLMVIVALAIAIKPFMGARVTTPIPAHEGSIKLVIGPIILALTGSIIAIFTKQLNYFIISPAAEAISGSTSNVELKLWAGFNSAVVLSIITLLFGITLFIILKKSRHIISSVFSKIVRSDYIYDRIIELSIVSAQKITDAIQNGMLRRYILITFLVTSLSILSFMTIYGAIPKWPTAPDLYFYEVGVLLLVILGVSAVLVAKTRLFAIIALGVQGFAIAVIFMLLGAPDLSFTQFMVETLSVIILALVMTKLKLDALDVRTKKEMLFDISISVMTGLGIGLLLLSVTQSDFDISLSKYFSEYSYIIAHGKNIVNVIIVDFRALDTLGEIAVVMVAGVAALALVGLRSQKGNNSKN